MNKSSVKKEKRERRHQRIRSKVIGRENRPRLSVYKSNKQIYAQIINDEVGKTLVAVSTAEVKGDSAISKAKEAGKLIAKKAAEEKIEAVVFDRGGFVYTGKIKALAEGAREGGLKF